MSIFWFSANPIDEIEKIANTYFSVNEKCSEKLVKILRINMKIYFADYRVFSVRNTRYNKVHISQFIKFNSQQ